MQAIIRLELWQGGLLLLARRGVEGVRRGLVLAGDEIHLARADAWRLDALPPAQQVRPAKGQIVGQLVVRLDLWNRILQARARPALRVDRHDRLELLVGAVARVDVVIGRLEALARRVYTPNRHGDGRRLRHVLGREDRVAKGVLQALKGALILGRVVGKGEAAEAAVLAGLGRMVLDLDENGQ